jgi:hypothetical protein
MVVIRKATPYWGSLAVVEFGGYKQRLAPSESTGNSTANRPSPHYPRRNRQRTTWGSLAVVESGGLKERLWCFVR